MTFAEYIERRGETRAHWAERLGVSRGFLSDVINGKKPPSLGLAVKIERETGGAIVASSWVPPRNAEEVEAASDVDDEAAGESPGEAAA